jgi:hypothetical protein
MPKVWQLGVLHLYTCLLKVIDSTVVVHGVVARLGGDNKDGNVCEIRELMWRIRSLLHARIVRTRVGEDRCWHQLGRVADWRTVCDRNVRESKVTVRYNGSEDSVDEGRTAWFDSDDATSEVGACIRNGPAERASLGMSEYN